MDEREQLFIESQVITQELRNATGRMASANLAITDAKTTVGDNEVDKEFAANATKAAQIILAQQRILDTRNARMAEIQARIAELDAAKK